MARVVGARTRWFFFEEHFEFGDGVRSFLLFLKRARRHSMREGVRPLQRMRLAAGGNRLIKAAVHELRIGEQDQSDLICWIEQSALLKAASAAG